jgi:NAD(P)-dependent dehydrogenase (short-subunit alcohol dehydrogenase family)
MKKHVVITGGTRGLGFALVKAFLDQGCRVTFSGTHPDHVQKAMEKLSHTFSTENFTGETCNIERVHDITDLYKKAVKHLGRVDIWINNAAIFNKTRDLAEFSDRQINMIFRVNLVGPIHVCRLIQPLMAQQGGGAIYNMEGFGSTGAIMQGRTLYGTSKRALRYFTRSFALETRNSPVTIGLINPGLTMTDMLKQAIPKRPDGVTHIPLAYRLLTYPPERVAKIIVKKVLPNTRHIHTVTYLTKLRIILSLFSYLQRRDAVKQWFYDS